MMLMDLPELHVETETMQKKLRKQTFSTIHVLQSNQCCFLLLNIPLSERYTSAALMIQWKDVFLSTTKYFCHGLT